MDQTSLIGLSGIALGDLKPTGKVLIEGAEHFARSEAGFIPQGEKIVVTSVGAFEVGVRDSRHRSAPETGGPDATRARRTGVAGSKSGGTLPMPPVI